MRDEWKVKEAEWLFYSGPPHSSVACPRLSSYFLHLFLCFCAFFFLAPHMHFPLVPSFFFPLSTSRRVSVGSAHSNLFCLNAPNGQTRTVSHTQWFTFIHWHTHTTDTHTLTCSPPPFPPPFPDTKKAPAGSLRSAHTRICTCRSVHKNAPRLVGSWLLGYALLLLFLSVPSYIMDAVRECVWLCSFPSV